MTTEAQRQKNRRQAERKWAAWKTEHVFTCADLLLGECCDCHPMDDLRFIVCGGKTFFICCNRLKANYVALGYSQTTLYGLATCAGFYPRPGRRTRKK